MTDDDDNLEEEFTLAQQIKDSCCDDSGKETKPKKSAEIFHQIGRIYRKRSPDKISLIKSAGLFNAAIVRNPSNVDQVKSDLCELCQHILQQANADKQNANLIKQADKVKISINKLRKDARSFLNKSLPEIHIKHSRNEYQKLMNQKISAIQQINKNIAAEYKKIMAKISKFCENVMGKPPCKYVIAGMGSMARDEITPYSDFEHIILLHDNETCKSHLDYFRWFSVIFHVIVLNLQETIIPSSNVCSLNDKNEKLGNWFYDAITPRGVSFDGMMPHASKFPLGRTQHTKSKQFTTELIKPVSEMLKYLSTVEDLKNGYHLADILLNTCFVFGNENIFKQFVDGVQNFRNQTSQTNVINDVQQQVKDDLNSFSTRFRLSELKSQNTINIKQLVYRSSTIFIIALARLYNVTANSCFDIINEMKQKRKISQNTAHKLQCAIAIACEMRLKMYAENNSQCDNVINLEQGGIDRFLNVVGVVNTINYFQITYCLQCEIAKQLKFTKLHFYSDPKLFNITICLAFGANILISTFKTTEKQSWSSSEFDFDKVIKQIENDINLNQDILNSNAFHSTGHFDLSQKTVEKIAEHLYEAKIYDEALEFYKFLLNSYRSGVEDSTNDNGKLANSNFQVGCCLVKLDKPGDALTYYTKAFDLQMLKTLDAEKDKDIALTLNNIGNCHLVLYNCDDALTYLNRALQIYQNATLNAEKDRSIATNLNDIGKCHLELRNYDNALKCLNRALQIYQKFAVFFDADRDLSITQCTIGRYFTELQIFDESWKFLEKSLKSLSKAKVDATRDISLANIFNCIGEYFIGKQDFAQAFAYFQQAIQIYQTFGSYSYKNTKFAISLYNIGFCSMKMKDYANALGYLKQSIEVYKSVPHNDYVLKKLASLRFRIDECCRALN